MGKKYIKPKLTIYNTGFYIDENSDNQFNLVEQFKKNDVIIIVGVGGTGKTSYLKDIVPSEISDIIYKDIKDYQSNIEKLIELIKTDKEYCIDALDEIDLNTLRKFLTKLNEVERKKIILSSRLDTIDFIKKNLDSNQVSVAIINLFSKKQVKEYLLSSGLNNEDVNLVYNYIINKDEDFLRVPRYLEATTNYIIDKLKDKEFNIESFINSSITDLLEAIIYKDLFDEKDKINDFDKIESTKRLLECLALNMEIYQRNKISKDELMTFIDDVDSDLKRLSIPLKYFYKFSLLEIVDDFKNIQFKNRSFQEYLAAKELNRLSKFSFVFYELAFNKTTELFYSKWSGATNFLIQLNPIIQKDLFKFILKQNQKDNNSFFIRSYSLAKEVVDSYSIVEKKEFLKFIIKNYPLLNYYLSSSDNNYNNIYFNGIGDFLLEKYVQVNETEKVIIFNLLAVLIENSGLKHEENIKQFLFKKLDGKKINYNHHIINCLVKYQDVDFLIDYIPNKIKEVSKNDYLLALIDTDINNYKVIDIVWKVIINEDISRGQYFSSINFDTLNKEDSILYLFRKIHELVVINSTSINEYELKNKIDGLFNYDIDLFLNELEDNNNNELLELIKEIVFKLYEEFSYRIVLIDKLLELLLNKRDLSFEWLIRKLSKVPNRVFYMRNLLSQLVTIDNWESIKEYYDIIELKKSLSNIFYYFQFSSDDRLNEVFNTSANYFKDEFENTNKNLKSIEEENKQRTAKRDMEILEKFIVKLEPEPKHYSPDIFKFYRENIKDKISIEIKSKERLKQLIQIIINWAYNPVFKIEKSGKGSYSHSISQNINTFNTVLPLLEDFNFKWDDYREKIVKFIPFNVSHYSTYSVKDIIYKLGGLTDEELENLINFYQEDRNDDYYISSYNNLSEIIQTINDRKYIPFLKATIERTDFKSDNYHCFNNDTDIKGKCLEQLSKFQTNDAKYFKEIFLNESYSYQMRRKALDLVLNHKLDGYKEIVQYIIEKIIENKFSNKDWENRDRPIKEFLYEFDYKIYEFQDIELIECFNKFLDELESVKEENSYGYYEHLKRKYINYINNLKLEDIPKVYNYFKEKSIGKDSNSYISDIANIVLYKYQEHLLSTVEFRDCIRKYNKIKKNDVLIISSIEELKLIVQDVLNNDLKKWINLDGGYALANYSITSINSKSDNPKQQKEDLLQKLFKSGLETLLLRRGFKTNEINIYREVQNIGNKKPDFTINFGLIGDIVIELKLTSSSELSTSKFKEYKDKLNEYAVNAEHLFLLIIKVDKEEFLKEKIDELENEIDKGFNVIFQDMS